MFGVYCGCLIGLVDAQLPPERMKPGATRIGSGRAESLVSWRLGSGPCSKLRCNRVPIERHPCLLWFSMVTFS